MKTDLLSRLRGRAIAPAREFGLMLLTAVTAAEVFAEGGPDAARGFYVAVGQRFAGLVDLSDVDDIDTLGERVNALMSACGYGNAQFTAIESGIKIVQQGIPRTIQGDQDDHWVQVFPAVLEGAYDAWFRQLGSAATLTTVIIRHEGDVIELHHGI
jgi:hypothetical protein